MPTVPPPQGVSEIDYETIEAAVTETVRGRWFLNEFARRNRATEMRQLLDAMARLEGSVAQGHAALPPADPSIRLLMQRIKEIAGQLDHLSAEMRAAGLADHFADAVADQARAVSGMIRSATASRPVVPSALPPAAPSFPSAAPTRPDVSSVPRLSRANLQPAPASPAEPPRMAGPQAPQRGADDPRLAILSGLDSLPLTEKLALFA